MKEDPAINPRFLRLLKSGKKKSQESEETPELTSFASQGPAEASHLPPVDAPEGESLLLVAEADLEVIAWVRKKVEDPTWSKGVRLFNLINQSLNPGSLMAKRVTLTIVKGTSFPDKRETCLEVVQKIRCGEHNGIMELLPDPYVDPRDPTRNDPWALKVSAQGYGPQRFLGYIPKAHEINKSFCLGMQNQIFCGAHLIGAKESDFKGERNQILTVACGWLEYDQQPQDTI
jgi:hypothetical protein